MLLNYLRIAFRNIWHNKTISFINFFGLAVSMSVCLLLIFIVADQYSYDDYHSKKNRIYRIITDRTELKQRVWSTATTAYPLEQIISEHQGIEKIVSIKRRFSGIAGWDNQEIPFHGYYTNSNFLSVFDFPLEKGNAKEALSIPNSIVLTKALASRIFGDTNPINEVIQIEEMGEFIVTGILTELPGKTHFEFDALTSIQFLEALAARDSTVYTGLDDWNNIYDSYLYVLLKDGTDPGDLTTIFTNAAKNNYDPEGKFEYEFKLQALTGITPGPLLSNTTGFGLPIVVIYILLGIAFLVLGSACFNYANLTTARAINRAKEIGVRKIVGARNRHVFAQFMLEALIISLFAFGFADQMVRYIIPKMNNFFLSMGAPMAFGKTPQLYLWFLLFAVLAGMLAGVIPALFFSATNPLHALKKTIQLNKLGRRAGFQRFDIRKVLMVAQFSFSIFFVITMITVYQQSKFVMNTDHGFRTEGILNVKLQGVPLEKVKPGFEALANVKLVAAATHLPALGTNNTIPVQLDDEQEPITVSYFGVDNFYINSMGLTLLAGTNFPDILPEEENSIIINQKAAQRFGWEDPNDAIGQIMEFGDKPLTIIGVIKDFHYERLDEKIEAMALRYQPQNANSAIVSINMEQAKETIVQLEAAWKETTNRPFEYTFFADDLRQSYGHFEALVMIMGYVTIIVLSIACLGLLGMVIYHIQNKTKEIGIRKTLGAHAMHILSTIGKSFFILILIAYAIGGSLAYLVNNSWLQLNEYHVDFGVVTIAMGFGVVLAIVLITIGSQFYKALNLNPVDSLKEE